MKLLVYFLENLRYAAFWSIDFLKGGKVRRHYKSISTILNNYTSKNSLNYREQCLENILNHATNTTPYYKNLGLGKVLTDFPVVNKNIIRSNFHQFQSKLFLNKKLKTVKTSGSTGLKFKVTQNSNKKIRNTADTIYFSNLVGFKVGYKLIYLRLWDKFLRKLPLVYFIQNIQPLNILNLNNSSIKKLIVGLEKDQSRKAFIAYASGLEQICRYLDKTNSKPIKSNLKSVIAIAEKLNEYTKTAVKKHFNTTIVSRYSNSENGIIAQQKIDNLNFDINWASYYLEILDFNTDTPKKNNEIGRIVITDLFNYATPMIRYDTGDIGSINYNVSPPVLTNIEGRKGDLIFNTQGEIVTKFITICLIPYDNIIQGQLIQEHKTVYTLKLNVNKDFKEEQKLINEFKKYLGHNAKINIEYVNEIPILSSGKRRLTVNNYIQQK